MNENQLEKIYGLLKDFSTVILVTMGGPTCCHDRPMAVAQVDENTDLWLFTSGDSEKVRQIGADSRVQIHAQQGYTSCVILAGRATVVEDRAMIREIWKPSFKVWFPEGAEDPNIVLLRIKGEEAEYWDSSGVNRFRYLYQSIKAIATGTTPEINEGEQHGNVALVH